MSIPEKLMAEFETPTMDQWRREVDRLLKGGDFAKIMLTRTAENVTVNPIYTAEDTANIPWLESLPGQAPFVRGTTAAGYAGTPWLVAQETQISSAQEFNKLMTSALEKGQTSVLLRLNSNEFQLPDLTAWQNALAGLNFEKIPVQIFAGGQALPVAAAVLIVAQNQGYAESQIEGCVGGDLYAELARLGSLPSSLEAGFCQVASLTEYAMASTPKLRTLLVEEQPWHEGGADLALSLGITLSSAVGLLREMDSRGLRPTSVAPFFQFNLEIGTDFFMEMAKLRALRLLWSRVLVASGVDADKTTTFVHSATARRDHSRLAPHVNMLRVTTEAMSAIMGGTNSLDVRPFDSSGGSLGLRIARNVQLILGQECGLAQVSDPAGGAHYVESLTQDLAHNAWAKFQEIESSGGIAAALESHTIQQAVGASALAKTSAVAQRHQEIVGVNKYPDPEVNRESMADAVGPAAQSARLRFVPAELAGKTIPDLQNALQLGTEIGALVAALHEDDQEDLVVDSIPLWRAAEPFELLCDKVNQAGAISAAFSRANLVCLGDAAAYGPRLDFAREFFAVGGFEVAKVDGEISAESALAGGAKTIVLVGLDADYLHQAPAVVSQLMSSDQGLYIVVAGKPPNSGDLTDLGVDLFITLKSDVVADLSQLLAKLEANS